MTNTSTATAVIKHVQKIQSSKNLVAKALVAELLMDTEVGVINDAVKRIESEK